MANSPCRDEEVAGSNPAIPTSLPNTDVGGAVTEPIGRVLPTVDAIVVAHGDEPLLEDCVASVLGSSDVDMRVLLIDNLCTNPALDAIAADPRVTLLADQCNDGFAGGVVRGLEAAGADHVALVNSDVTVPAETIATLVAVLEDATIGIVAPRILRRADGLVNSDGNPLHVLGYSWAGGNGDVPQSGVRRDVAIASGAALVARTSILRRLDAPDPRFFLYHEDTDLSLACHQQGLRVVVEPSVTVEHDYAWDRNPDKLMLAERNRILILLTRYPARLLLRIIPLLVTVEIGALILGGLPEARRAKMRGYRWMVRNAGWIRSRRASNLTRATHPEAPVAHMTLRFDSSAPEAGRGPALLDGLVPFYLRLVGHPIATRRAEGVPRS